MKPSIHPKYNTDITVTCACGNAFVTGSTKDTLRMEICGACHPFYTGQERLIDTARRVEKFQEKMAKVSGVAEVRKGKKVKEAALKAKKQAKAAEEAK